MAVLAPPAPGRDGFKARAPSAQPTSRSSKYASFVVTVVMLMLCLHLHSLWRTPTPLPSSAPAELFSEGRALEHVHALAVEAGPRWPGTSALDRAADSMERAAEAVAALARATRPDLVVEVVREATSGGFVLNAFGHEFTNAFNNLTNVVLRVTPRGREHVPGVLLNAHYDSALGSPGASDAASCVGVALEVARTLVADSSQELDAPVVVLLNGGEETLMQAAQGFLESGSFSRNLGAFLNLESTGPWGPEILFQSTNDWTLGTYLRAVPHPRCSSVFQDFFDLNLFPADTDFRVLAKTRLGSLPGVDSAQLFDGVAYHTTQDNFGRIRRGTLQSSGENALAATRAFAARMLSQANQPADIPDEGDGEAEDTPLRADAEEGSVAFDVLGRWAVVYSHATARVLHHVPIGVLVSAALVGSLLGPKAPRLLTLGTTATSLGADAVVALFSVVLAHVFPAAVGALRALVSGKPMIWYGRPLLLCALYLPPSLFGLLLPYALRRPSSVQAARQAVLGASALFGAAASSMALHGMLSGTIWALWSAAGVAFVLAELCLAPASRKLARLVQGAGAGFALCASLPLATCTLLHVSEKMGLSGSPPGLVGELVGDGAAGVAAGAATYLAFGSLAALLVGVMETKEGFGEAKEGLSLTKEGLSLTKEGLSLTKEGLSLTKEGLRETNEGLSQKEEVALPRRTSSVLSRRSSGLFFVMKLLLVFSVAAAAIASLLAPPLPYTPRAPKRLLVQHVHRFNTHSSHVVNASVWSVGSVDSVRAEQVLAHCDLLKEAPRAASHPRDWASFHPFGALVDGATRAAPPPDGSLPFPRLTIMERRAAGFENGRGLVRGVMQLETHRGGAFAAVNATGAGLLAWSFSPRLPAGEQRAGAQGPPSYFARLSAGSDNSGWDWWIEGVEGSIVHVEVAVKHLHKTAALQKAGGQVPDWVSPVMLTAYHMEHDIRL